MTISMVFGKLGEARHGRRRQDARIRLLDRRLRHGLLRAFQHRAQQCADSPPPHAPAPPPGSRRVWLWFTRASCERSASSRLRTRARASRTAASSAWTTRPVSEPTARSISCRRDRAARTSGWLGRVSPRAVPGQRAPCRGWRVAARGWRRRARSCRPRRRRSAPRPAAPRPSPGTLRASTRSLLILLTCSVDSAALTPRVRPELVRSSAMRGLGLAELLPQLADPAVEPVIGPAHRVELALELVRDVELGGEIRRIHRQARILRGELHGQHARIAHHRHLQPVAHGFGRGDLGALLGRPRAGGLGRHQFRD